MKLGATVVSEYQKPGDLYMCALTVRRALDSSGRCLGEWINCLSPRLPSMVQLVSTTDGSVKLSSVVYSTSHYFFKPFPSTGGGAFHFLFGSHKEILTSYFVVRETLGTALGTANLTAWPFRYIWGENCPVPVGTVKSPYKWADVLAASRSAGVALPIIRLADCLSVLYWRDASGRRYALPLFPAVPLRSGAGGTVADTYRTPPLMKDEQTAFMTLCEDSDPTFEGMAVRALPLGSQTFSRSDDEKIFTVKFSSKWS